MKSAAAFLAFSVLTLATPALSAGMQVCTPDPYTVRMSPEQASARARMMGFKVVAVEPDSGCYRVEAKDDRGRKVVLRMHAGTGELMARIDPVALDRTATASTD